MILWLNGTLVSGTEARIDPADRGFTLGDGLFETIRVAGGTARHLSRHLDRLAASAAVLELPVPYPAPVLSTAVADLIAAHGLSEGVLRLTLTRGVGARGLPPPPKPHPTLVMTLAPASPPAGPVAAVISQGTRRNEHSPLSRLKTLNALDAILARQEATRRGAGEALLLNTAGRLAEASVANLFVVRNGRLLTPPLAEGVLPGIRRGLIRERHGAEEAPIAIADLLKADEAFLSNSLSVRPLLAVDGQAIGSGAPGPVTEAVRQAAEAD